MTRRRYPPLFLWPGLLVAVVYLAVLPAVAWPRLLYPFELEWVEGAVLIEVKRVLAGAPLYTPPSPTYVPLIYPPLYFYASALAAWFVGPTFLAPRLVSLLSSFITLLLVGVWVRRESGDGWAALAAMGLYAMLYRVSDTWYDVGRVDAFALMWGMAGLYALRHTRTWRGAFVAALAFLLAFWSKQSMIWLVVPMLGYALILAWARNRREHALFAVSFVALLITTSLLAHLLTRGWITYYLWRLPARFQVVFAQAWFFWEREILASTALAFAGLLLFLWWEVGRSEAETAGFFAAAFLGLMGTAWLSRSHAGSFLNDLMPAHLALALGWGLFLARLRAAPFHTSGKEGAAGILILLQMVALVYDPRAVLPPADNLRAGQMVVERLRRIDGDVFVPFHPYLAEAAGKPLHAHMAGITDVLRSDPEGEGARLRAWLTQAIRERRFAAILLEQDNVTFVDQDMEHLVEATYGPPLHLFHDNRTLRTITGWRIRPERLYYEEKR